MKTFFLILLMGHFTGFAADVVAEAPASSTPQKESELTPEMKNLMGEWVYDYLKEQNRVGEPPQSQEEKESFRERVQAGVADMATYGEPMSVTLDDLRQLLLVVLQEVKSECTKKKDEPVAQPFYGIDLNKVFGGKSEE